MLVDRLESEILMVYKAIVYIHTSLAFWRKFVVVYHFRFTESSNQACDLLEPTEMLTFELNLNQRDSAIQVFNRLNGLIFSDGQPPEEINECAQATTRLINMLNNLRVVQNNLKSVHGESSNGAFDSTTECPPAKKSRSEVDQRDQIMFDLQLNELLNIIGQIMKNQNVAIKYSNSVVQADKIRLLRENTSMIKKLHDLPLRRKDKSPSADEPPVANRSAVDGGSSGNRPSCRYRVTRFQADWSKVWNWFQFESWNWSR